jgi:hypothetical protein
MKPRTLQLSAVLLLFITAITFPQLAAAEGIFQSILWNGIVVGFLGFFVGLAGWLLNIGVTEYVVGFGKSFLESGIGAAVDTLWIAVRDIFNISFIFGLVFIGFKMILDSDDSGTRRWLVHLILAAILVNFSLYFTKFVVDFSNLMATQIANTFSTTGTVIDISGAFMDRLGITSIFNAPKLTATGYGAYGYIFGSMIMFIVMIFVFAAGGFMLIIRYVSLCFYMVLSPLMFIGWVFPQLQSYTDKYWRGFLGKSFFAPIYLLLVYFSYYIVTAFTNTKALTGGMPDFSAGMGGDGTVVIDKFDQTFVPFIISCIFLIASIVVASKLGADGAATAMNLGKNLTGRAKGYVKNATVGSTKFVASQTAGRVARRTSNLVGGSLERQISKLQTKGGVGGYIARTQLAESARQKSASVRDAKFGLGVSLQDDRKRNAAIGSAATERANGMENNTKRDVAVQNYQQANAVANDTTRTQADRDAAAKDREVYRAEVAQRTKNTTDDELLKMDKEKITDIAEHLSDKQLDTLEKSGNFSTFGSNSDIQKLKDARAENTFKDFVTDLDDATTSADRLGEAIKGMASTMKSMSDERLTGMSVDNLKDARVAMHLSGDQLKTLRTSGKYSATQISEIEKAREDGINETIINGSVANIDKTGTRKTGAQINSNASNVTFQNTQRQNIFKRSVKEVGLLPVSTFTKPESFKYITPAMLEERMKNGISGNETAIKNALTTHLRVPAGAPPSSSGFLLNSNPWVKWEGTVYGAQFFA